MFDYCVERIILQGIVLCKFSFWVNKKVILFKMGMVHLPEDGLNGRNSFPPECPNKLYKL